MKMGFAANKQLAAFYIRIYTRLITIKEACLILSKFVEKLAAS
jgi:hypothetical protein